MDRPIAYVRLTVDTLVARGPVLFYGSVHTNDSNGVAGIRIRDGRNANGREVMFLETLHVDAGVFYSVTLVAMLPKPILLRDGLFVDVVANLSSCTVFFRPVRDEQIVGLVEDYVEGGAE